MKTRTIIEQPLLVVKKPYDGGDLEIYAADIKAAEVGEVWETENQDCYPNRTCTWLESFTLIYKDENGAAVLYRSKEAESLNYYNQPVTELIWVELH